MPLSCTDGGKRIQAFDLTDAEWSALRGRKSRDHHLRMPCCSAPVVLKRSSRGTRFFAHKNVGACVTADETEEHRHLKTLAVEAARASGWLAETEVTGRTPTGEVWRADVLATKGNAKVAIEVQWSGQTPEETLRRQAQYREAGVRGLWLLRQPGFPVLRELPACCVGGDLRSGFLALVPAHDRMTARHRKEADRWRQTLPISEFLSAAFERRLRFIAVSDALGPEAVATIYGVAAECWSDLCGAVTPIVTAIEIATDHGPFRFSLADLTEFDAATKVVVDNLPSEFSVQLIQKRFSRTQRRTYLSNGCSGCGRFFGELMAIGDPESVVARFRVSLDQGWLRLLKSHPDVCIAQPAWWVLPRDRDAL